MSARDEILSRIRTALRDVPDSTPAEDSPIDWEYGRPATMPDMLGRFVERVADYRATVVRRQVREVPAAIVEALIGQDIDSVVIPAGASPSWAEAVSAAGVRVRRDEPPLTADELDGTGAAVTAAAVGIAETGTIVLDHGPDQGRRALTLLPDLHVCVVMAGQIVPDVAQAVARLAPAVADRGQPLTWISGPSATSDIELDRVEGVHGPRTLHVILAE